MTDKVLLVGMMGAGKSTVGAALGTRLGWPYLDNDALLERTTGKTAPVLLESDGSEALREAEAHVLTLVLGMPGPLVAGVAGGVVLDSAVRERLTSSTARVVWLRATVPVLARRVGTGAGRARLGDDPVAALRKLAAERHPYFEEVCDQVVDVDALAPGAVAKLLAEGLS